MKKQNILWQGDNYKGASRRFQTVEKQQMFSRQQMEQSTSSWKRCQESSTYSNLLTLVSLQGQAD